MWEDLLDYAGQRGLNLPERTAPLYMKYYQVLEQFNKIMNLTGITDPREAMIKHFIDSLEILALFPGLREKVMDVGSGAGFPGIPLAIACPDVSVTLLDSSDKKVKFLSEAIHSLGLNHLRALRGRAEETGRDPLYRERYPLVLSRAVARLNVLLELCLPFVAPDGVFVAYKGPEAGQELREARNALIELKSCAEQIWEYELPEQRGKRALIVIKKLAPLDEKYPRKSGIPAKRPL